jgi:intergrase/recombinase
MDVINIFAELTQGQKHNLNRTLRNLLNFLELKGYSKDWLDILRKDIPKDEVNLDLNIPSEEEIIISLKALNKAKKL